MIFFTPVIAIELEFYLLGSAGRELAPLWDEVRIACDAAGIPIYKIEKEKGGEQYEVALSFVRDAAKAVADANGLKRIMSELAARHGMEASFAAKPLPDEPGSGLHVHIHIEDLARNNLYTKQDAQMSSALSYSIGGLLAKMQEDMHVFAPTKESLKRFVAGSNAPTTASWGANNRTCAIRLPDTGSAYKHIEHRVAGADADVGAVVETIISAIKFGIEHQIPAPEQIYGDASLEQYGLPKLV